MIDSPRGGLSGAAERLAVAMAGRVLATFGVFSDRKARRLKAHLDWTGPSAVGTGKRRRRSGRRSSARA